MSKPIIRWIIGPVTEEGFDCLCHSVKLIQNLYQNRFTYIICCNNLSKNQESKLPPVDNFVNQNDFSNCLPFPPPTNKGKPAWKLYPPRINPFVHEIIIDNDLIIYRKHPSIEEFLKRTDLFVVTQAIKRSYSERFSSEIPDDFNINSGLLCLPPFFDYQKEIVKLLKIPEQWEEHTDEQTIIASILTKKSTKIIPFSEISVCYKEFKKGTYGTHFVGLNSGFVKSWNLYKNCSFL